MFHDMCLAAQGKLRRDKDGPRPILTFLFLFFFCHAKIFSFMLMIFKVLSQVQGSNSTFLLYFFFIEFALRLVTFMEFKQSVEDDSILEISGGERKKVLKAWGLDLRKMITRTTPYQGQIMVLQLLTTQHSNFCKIIRVFQIETFGFLVD